MKTTITGFIIGLLFLNACSQISEGSSEKDIVVSASSKGVVDVSSIQFNQLIESGKGVVLDVRTQGEVDRGFIRGAVFFDIYDSNFEENINKLPKNEPVYVYCKAGGRSASAANILIQNGFRVVYNLQGGFDGWTESGYEINK